MKNLKKVSRNQLRTIKGGYKSCLEGGGCDFEAGLMCCNGKCRMGVIIPSTDPDMEDTMVCPS
jgi:hypothetical protein